MGPRLGFRASLTLKCPGITAWFRLDFGTNQFKAGKYVVGIGKYNTLLLPCGRSRLSQRHGRVFAFRSWGPGSIPTSGGWDFSAPCDNETPGRQLKQSNQLSLPHQDDCNTRTDTKQRTTKHRTITDSHNGSNNKQKVNNNRTTSLERTAA